MRLFLILFSWIFIYSCTSHKVAVKEIIKIDHHWLDSIINKSDTTWIKPYRNNYFVKAEYYVDRKDSIVTQVMKDSSDNIRQINIAKYDNYRLFFAEYYVNGQLMAKLPLDATGKFHGNAKLYYENGMLKSEGQYSHGFHTGEWNNFDNNGRLIFIDKYDNDGQLIRTTKVNN